jgi:putative transposase
MTRKLLERSDLFPYHLTARVNNKEPFPIPLDEMWQLIAKECFAIGLLYDVEFHALVLMPNHFHMILTLPNPDYDLGKVMSRFMSELTLSCHRKSGRCGRLFGRRYHWSIIKSSRYYGHVLKYVFRNPVKAKLCDSVEDYEFSTLRGMTGHRHLPFPIHFTRCGLETNLPEFELQDRWLNWLNTPFPNEAEALIQKCLLKKEIDSLLCRYKRIPEPLLEVLL